MLDSPRVLRLSLVPLLLCAATAAVAEPPRDVVLISVDTLRADTLHCYGFPAEVSPTIDGLAKRGVLFEDVITTIGKTGPAFASLFTSLYPPTHGARRNGVRIRDDVPLLAEMLEAAGFRTGAIVSNWTLRANLAGLDRGFGKWDERFDKNRYGVGPREREADSVTEAALLWVDNFVAAYGQGADRPRLFLWAHYSDPHSPYRLHDEHAVDRELAEGVPEKQKYWRYISEVGYTDRWIAHLLDELESRIDLDRTLVIFLSDHGESFGEHGYWGHGKNTHWPNLRIPLIFAGPGLPRGERVTTPASLVDVLPTLLELLELEPPELIEGRSLVGSWRQAPPEERPRFAFGERATAIDKVARENYEHPLEISAETSSVKTIYDFGNRRVRYYDLQADPTETHPLEQPPLRRRPPLHQLLAQWYRDLIKYDRSEGELSAEDVEQLEALGYIGD